MKKAIKKTIQAEGQVTIEFIKYTEEQVNEFLKALENECDNVEYTEKITFDEEEQYWDCGAQLTFFSAEYKKEFNQAFKTVKAEYK